MKKWLETDSFEEAFEKYNENMEEIDNTFELKANKQQEAWITPTLLNGATGTVQYRKNQFGRVELKGEITQAVTASRAFNFLPSYHQSGILLLSAFANDGTVGNIYITGSAVYLSGTLADKTVNVSSSSFVV